MRCALLSVSGTLWDAEAQRGLGVLLLKHKYYMPKAPLHLPCVFDVDFFSVVTIIVRLL